ncbi:Replication protein A 70 kDa DNA-binding subunit B [Camellia lanceoleosa]|uniref:Replication protein A 70 kDa DNA-binding subunit B n=1 Tax=Camellia lanceoleosa TaxID=1840588 RepID=A0ACC0FNQ1_9ERIC|nr:Replication protein A 70 kDa DNA-binding subunit B [Camellia lanceoleosa]
MLQRLEMVMATSGLTPEILAVLESMTAQRRRVLVQFLHHKAASSDALIGIRDIFLKYPTELRLHKLAVIEKLRERISDDDKLVRETLYQLLKSVIFPTCKEVSDKEHAYWAYSRVDQEQNRIDLSYNKLSGSVEPSTCRETLNLFGSFSSGNHFSCSLSFILLSGDIHFVYYTPINMRSVIVGDLSFNELYGDIPFSVSKLKQLEHLILKNNQLIGPIPSTLSQIPNLKLLDLAQNKLSGEIPRLIYWNEVLQYLRGLRGNNLVGTLSPDMCQLTGLWHFDVRNNSLIGSIPQNIGNCTTFQVLYDSEGKEVSMASIGSGMSSTTNTGTRSMYIDRVTLSYITQNQSLGEDKPVFFSMRAYISFIKPDQTMWYRACKTCNKKVTEAIGSGYWCEGCQKNDEECSLRYIMVVKVSDASGEAWLSVFNEQAEKIIGCSADELDKLKSQEGEGNFFQLKLKSATWVPHLFRVSVTPRVHE